MKIPLLIFLMLSLFCAGIAQPDVRVKDAQIDSVMEAHLRYEGKQPAYNFLLYAQNQKTAYEVHKGVGIYGHGGFYGSLLLYSPEEEIIFSANIGQANLPYDVYALVMSIVDIMISE